MSAEAIGIVSTIAFWWGLWTLCLMDENRMLKKKLGMYAPWSAAHDPVVLREKRRQQHQHEGQIQTEKN